MASRLFDYSHTIYTYNCFLLLCRSVVHPAAAAAVQRAAHPLPPPGFNAAATLAALGTPEDAPLAAEDDDDDDAPMAKSRGTISGSAIPSPPRKQLHITTGSRCIAR